MAGTTRRSFLGQLLCGAGALAVGPSLEASTSAEVTIEISLAEWSLHRAIYGGKLDHLDFPRIAKEKFGISSVEYVNGFFGAKTMDFRAAKTLGCRTVRVNLHGEERPRRRRRLRWIRWGGWASSRG